MALNKHEKLARELVKIKNEIDDFFDKVSKQLDFVQHHVFKKGYNSNDLPITKGAFGSMVKSHHLALRYYSPDPFLAYECSLKHGLGMPVNRPIYFKSEFRKPLVNVRVRHRWTVWGIKSFLPSANISYIEKAKQKAWLYCAAINEIPFVPNWYESEEKADSFVCLR